MTLRFITILSQVKPWVNNILSKNLNSIIRYPKKYLAMNFPFLIIHLDNKILFPFSFDSLKSTQVLLRYILNYSILPVLMFKYCMAVPVPQKPVYPDSHKNLVNVSWLVRLYMMVLDRVYWHPDGEASEWTGVSVYSV